MSDLLPCPFCAETEMLRLESHSTREGTQEGWIECMNCGARGQTEYGRCPPDEMEALIRYGWNDRTALKIEGQSDG